jgi:hypothetical protein
MNDETKQIEFGKLSNGAKFYLVKPVIVDERTACIKTQSQKDQNGAWSNAKNIYGLTMFVQYDKRVWTKV